MKLADSPGTIALPTHEMGRFLLFTISLAGTNQPPNCYLNASASASVTENLNKIMGDVTNDRPDDAWVWIMGDDHCWSSTALVDMLRLMDRHPEIDVLVPLVTKRNPPWHLVVFDEVGEHDDDGTPMFRPIPWERVPESGVFEVDAAGSAGMLIRRHVLETVEAPWFFSTLDVNGRQVILNEDVSFCTRIRHEYGMRIFATSDVVLGHLGIFNVRPMHNGERWGALTEFSTMDDKFRHVFMPVEETEPAKKTSDVPERAASSLARVGLTLEEARSKTDEELLGIPGVGKAAVKLMRDHPDLVRSKRASTNEEIGV